MAKSGNGQVAADLFLFLQAIDVSFCYFYIKKYDERSARAGDGVDEGGRLGRLKTGSDALVSTFSSWMEFFNLNAFRIFAKFVCVCVLFLAILF